MPHRSPRAALRLLAAFCIAVGNIDGDGDLDVLACEEQEGGRGLGVFWYENPCR